jgi:DNA-binding transcriptional MerR regulator
MYSISEVAQRIGVKRFRISYAHQMGYLPEVARFHGARLYTEDDLRLVEAYFEAKGRKNDHDERGSG